MNKKQILLQLGLVILLGALCVFFLARNVSLEAAIEGIRRAHLTWLALAAVMLLLSWLLEAAVLKVMIGKRAKLGLFDSFYSTMVGQMFNQLTPMAAGGQPAQLYVLVKKGVPGGSATSILLMKFLVFQVVLVLSFSGILIVGYGALVQAMPQLKLLMLIGYGVHVIVIVAMLLVVFYRKLAEKLAYGILFPVRFISKRKAAEWKAKLGGALVDFHEKSRQLVRSKRALLVTSLLTTAQLLLFFSVPYFIFQALGAPNITLLIGTVFHAFVVMFATVVPTPGGSGAAEMTFSGLFQSFVSPATLLIALLFWRILTSYSTILVGFVLILGESRKKIRRVKEKAVEGVSIRRRQRS